MKALTMQQANLVPGAPPPWSTSVTNPASNYSPNLENKVLAQSATMKSQLITCPAQPSCCPALQPSKLASTSSLLSASALSSTSSSPLLSTQNKLLTERPLRPSFPLTSSVIRDFCHAGSALVSHFAQPLTLVQTSLGDEEDEEISEEMHSSFEETSAVADEDEVLSEDEGEAGEPESTMELLTMAEDLKNQELEPVLVFREEQFGELDGGNKKAEEDLKDKKYLLLNAVCCSLVHKSKAPGQEEWDSEDSVWTTIQNLGKDISGIDPQFLLKVAVYTRQELNIRITANFILAFAANLPSTKPHVRRYFCAAVQLPSDWLEVVRIYSTCFSRSLPMCLKKAMADKFKQFSEYQLAKYNTRKHRCKHSTKKRKGKKPTDEQLKQWADLVRSDPSLLKNFFQYEGSKAPVDKKQSEFNMKKMIKRLHINDPAEHVMAILGKKYPRDLKSFTHSGLKGAWDRDRAGQRMKLKEPRTWEQLLSAEGNKAATWEKLIDSKSLPFMAMLRNLRNMIIKGISEAHHKKILSRLTNQKAVVQSRQFPFRFLSAYKVIMVLRAEASVQQVTPTVKQILVSILKKIPKSRRFKRQEWETTPKKRLKSTLRMPYISQMYRMKKAQLLKANQKLFSVELLDRYRSALETAVQISCRYNVPPLPGKTVILLPADISSDESWSRKQDFCLPFEPKPKDSEKNEEEEEEEKKTRGRRRRRTSEHDELTPSVSEVAALLSLMIRSSAEDCQLCIYEDSHCEEAKLESDVLLENVKAVIQQMKKCSDLRRDEYDVTSYPRLFNKNNKLNNIINIGRPWMSSELEWEITAYKKEVNRDALEVQICIAETKYSDSDKNQSRSLVKINGFSDQVLRFVAERGSSRLLEHVENMDKKYKIPPPEGAKGPESPNSFLSLPASPKLRWQGVRVFISSTFRDMHAERDVLVRSVFPELRRRAMPHRLHLQEVELRWGVTEEESERAVELCLSEVCRSHMLVGILGERYGQVPPRPVLPELPQYNWLSSAPAGMSITEMEIRQFQALYPDTANQRMFCYFRDPNVVKSIPVAWRSSFAAESKEAEEKIKSLKTRLLSSEVKVTENYSCEWGGVVDGSPYLKHLEDFGKAVLEDLWAAVQNIFLEKGEETEASSDVLEQEVHQEALHRQFFGRAKLLSGAEEMVKQICPKGGMVVIEAGPGEGKTLFMAALAVALRAERKSRELPECNVISYSASASQSARSVENLLSCLVQWLRKVRATDADSPLPHSYKDLLSEFHSMLSSTEKSRRVVLLVDGADLIQDGKGRLSSDWIPQQLPQGVCLVLSMASKAALLQTLTKKRGAVLFSLGPLTMPDRKEIVRKELDAFGKKLSDSAFNNQLQTLITKKGAVSPLFLHLACDDLRNFASFDKLKESLDALPQSLNQLVQHSLERLCSLHRGMLGLRWALGALTVSSTGLKERDFYVILNICNQMSAQGKEVTWQEVLQLFRKSTGRIPMATFTRLVHSLHSLIGPSQCHDTEDLLALNNLEVRRAFQDALLPAESDRARAHLILAAHLWAVADPQRRDTFFHCEADSIMQLPSSLIHSGQLEAVHSLLSSYHFLYANVSHGLVHHIMETYSLYDQKRASARFVLPAELEERLEDCRGFLRRHASTLSTWPAVFIQQALNEPSQTSVHSWAQQLLERERVRVVECRNSSNNAGAEISELVSTFSSHPSCGVLSPDGRLMVVGTGQGTLHIINTQTGQEVRSLLSSCDGISSCVFLVDGQLAATSFDGQMELWDIENGCRTALIAGHTNMITGSDITSDRKHLATVSLDFTLKVWSSKCSEVASLSSSSPLNCVAFNPEGRLLAAGCWNGNVIVWNWLQNKGQKLLCGHQRSVHCLSFFPSSSMLCSGSVCGEVRVWSVPTSTCVGCFQAHCGAVEAFSFLEGGAKLLSAGADHTLQLWSGGLGRSVAALKREECEQEPPEKKLKSVKAEPVPLCVSVNGDQAAVGYHGDGIRLFNLDSGKEIWASQDLHVSVHCLQWVVLDTDSTQVELLVSGGGEKSLRVWKKQKDIMADALTCLKTFGIQTGSVLAMAQNSEYLATASDDFTIVLWRLSHLAPEHTTDPHAVLRGHKGGVTCLAFSPDESQLLSGGKDQSLIVWQVNSSPVVSKSLLRSHRDWITGCVWTSDCMMSSSNDGRVCIWDAEAGHCIREISWRNPLTSICSQGGKVIASCSEGELHVWNWETSTEVCHMSAHKQRIHHCTLITSSGKKEEDTEELTVVTASDDGSVRIWKPLQMDHFCTFSGHSGAVCGVVHKEGLPEFLTVSEDCSLRRWTWTAERTSTLNDRISTLCFSETEDLLLAGYESGFLELWQNNTTIVRKQVSNSPITAACSMPNNLFAVSCLKDLGVDVWKLVSNQQSKMSLIKTTSYKVKEPVLHLLYTTQLVCVTTPGNLHYLVAEDEEDDWSTWNYLWNQKVRVRDCVHNDPKSLWLIGESDDKVHVGFLFDMGLKTDLHSSFSALTITFEEDEKPGSPITAVSMDKDFVVCGDMDGNMWFNQQPNISSWSKRKPAHTDGISRLKITPSTIISASYDHTVKVWDRNTKKQLGMFVCGGPVLLLQVNPRNPGELACADGQGKLFLLSWKE
ncbi:telomerase protein component 1 isoform X2 [Oryzias melastigma]|uniref:telomerase protein component 1 isoform X2 n=1 Tax=Oryzias melastigma TaxID=30732 RepID=UPI000CF7C049|nr:telomerase protein component 1 isoform X2 [Oryzias melastigma]